MVIVCRGSMSQRSKLLTLLHMQGEGADLGPELESGALSSERNQALQEEDKSKSGSSRFPRARILYVDDEPRISRVIKYGLEKYGFGVDSYTNPSVALSEFKAGHYDMLLIDVRLPEIDGLELCSRLLKIDNKVKVCFITAYELEEEEVKKRVSNLQSRCIIKKPVSFETLVSKINSQIQGE